MILILGKGNYWTANKEELIYEALDEGCTIIGNIFDNAELLEVE